MRYGTFNTESLEERESKDFMRGIKEYSALSSFSSGPYVCPASLPPPLRSLDSPSHRHRRPAGTKLFLGLRFKVVISGLRANKLDRSMRPIKQ